LGTEDSRTNYLFFENREALVLAGGGARAAYQVGVLRAIAKWLPEGAPCPFPVLVGTSAGALNAAALAARARHMGEAVTELERVWAGFHVNQVVRTDPAIILRSGLRWVLSALSGGWLLAPPRSLLDTTPLRELLGRVIPLERIPDSMAGGPVQALAVATTSYTTGKAVAFFDAVPTIDEWNRVRRTGVRRSIDLDVLMASSAIPFIFPSARVDGDYYGDGAMRQLAPLSPAVHLGANRVMVVGTRADLAASPADGSIDTPPSPGHLLGFVLDFIEITFVVVPIVGPVLLTMGLDPVWLGIMIAINLQTSFLTPPFGFALFYLRGVAPPSVTTAQIYRGAVPFVGIQLLALLLLALFPDLVTWLPNRIYGS